MTTVMRNNQITVVTSEWSSESDPNILETEKKSTGDLNLEKNQLITIDYKYSLLFGISI